MNNDTKKDYASLLEGILTKEDLNALIDQIDALNEALFQVSSSSDSNLASKNGDQSTPTHFDDAISRIFPYAKKERVQKIIQDSGIDQTSLVAVQDVLKSMKSYLETISVCSLTLAFEPSQEQLKKIQIELSDETQTLIVLEVFTDRSIIGGMLIAWRGKYHDYSLKKWVQEYFTNLNKLSPALKR